MHSVPVGASGLLVFELLIHRMGDFLAVPVLVDSWSRMRLAVTVSEVQSYLGFRRFRKFSGFTSKIKIHHSYPSVNTNIRILRHVEQVFEPYRMSFKELNE